MTEIEDGARRLLTPLRELAPEAPEAPEAIAGREARVVTAMLAIVSADRRRRRRTNIAWAGATLVVAAAAALCFAAPRRAGPRDPAGAGVHLSELHGDVSVIGADGRRGLAQGGQPLGRGDRLIVSEGAGASVLLASGAAAGVDGGTELAIGGTSGSPAEERLLLSLGSVSLHVPPLGPGRALAVVTPHVAVSVVGTRFSVTVVPTKTGEPSRTCVVVRAGTVRVASDRDAKLLRAGQLWSSDGGACDRDPPSAVAGHDPVTMPHEPVAASSASSRRTLQPEAPLRGARFPAPAPTPSTSAPSTLPPTAVFSLSTLERQNQLFVAAMAARRAGDSATALALLDQLLDEHPDSPLATQARRECDALRGFGAPERPYP